MYWLGLNLARRGAALAGVTAVPCSYLQFGPYMLQRYQDEGQFVTAGLCRLGLTLAHLGTALANVCFISAPQEQLVPHCSTFNQARLSLSYSEIRISVLELVWFSLFAQNRFKVDASWYSPCWSSVSFQFRVGLGSVGVQRLFSFTLPTGISLVVIFSKVQPGEPITTLPLAISLENPALLARVCLPYNPSYQLNPTLLL